MFLHPLPGVGPRSSIHLEDFLQQMKKMKKIGSMRQIMKMVPGMGSQLDGLDMDDGELGRFEAIIHSMTPKERRRPEIVEASRRRRIARGSGTDPKDVSGLIKSFAQVRDMMKAMSGMSMMDRMKSATQFAQMAAGGIMPKLKIGRTVKKRRESRQEKRKRRKKHRR